MRRGVAVVLCGAALVTLCGGWTTARAGDDRSDFALFDGTNPANQGPGPGVLNPASTGVAGAVCGVKKAGKTFTFHVTVTNDISGAAGFVRLTYKDGDFVQYPMAPGDKFSFSQAGGSKGGADQDVRISGVPAGPGGVRLVGAMSATADPDAKVFCASCDATTQGGIGDAGCDKIVPD